MPEPQNEFADLKREIIEARNQAIKTDNQIKNLSLDVKSFERRFDGLERRTRMSSVAVYAIIAVTIGAAAWAVGSVRGKNHESALTQLQAELDEARTRAEKAQAQLSERQTNQEKDKQRRAEVQAAAVALNEHLDAKREKEAIELLPTIDLALLSRLERQVLERRIIDLKKRAAEAAMKAARTALTAQRWDSAATELGKALKIDADERTNGQARYLLASALFQAKRFEQAEPVLREILKKESERTALEDAKFWLAMTLAKLERPDEAKTFLEELASNGRYAAAAKSRLQAIAAGTEVSAEATAPSAAPPAAPAAPSPSRPAAAAAADATPASRAPPP